MIMTRTRNPWVLIILLIVGGLSGSALDQLLVPTFPFLKTIITAGLDPAVLDFGFMSVTFGFSLSIGPLTLLGFLLGFLAYRKL